MRALLRVALAGCLLDTLLGSVGVFSFDQRPLPVWLALLWLVLASGLRHSLAWTGRPYWRAALVGMFSGPLAYLAGARLTGVDLPMGHVGTGLLLAPIWALVLPLAVRVASWR
ncbi:Membrane protein [Pseudomonas wadenswilerensis]|uniref:Membrane protein n=1 Tax=Pseudomonas wadenswilerensis TaxID=1785161 RepID=A0A380T950_9PSED|nr:Membrane protein [Pseudomonas wadenswilerensis]